jgi:hypothetical protein
MPFRVSSIHQGFPALVCNANMSPCESRSEQWANESRDGSEVGTGSLRSFVAHATCSPEVQGIRPSGGWGGVFLTSVVATTDVYAEYGYGRAWSKFIRNN